MSNLIFSLNATLPVFFCMMLGALLKKAGIIDDAFASKMNTFVFKVALPINLFEQLHLVDFFEVWDTSFVLYCFLATAASIAIAYFISRFLKDRTIRGEFVQASYRSSSSLLGMAYIQNIYGTASTGSLMMIGSVPLYNVAAVVILSLMSPQNTGLDRKRLKKTLIGIVTNPIILGILIGFVWAMLKIPMPTMFEKTLAWVSATSSPLGLIAMGASLDLKKITGRIRPAIPTIILKLIVFVALFIPVAIAMGFRTEKLVAALIMLGSATTVASYVMAKNMGHEGTLGSTVIMLTTLLSSLTLTFWIWLLRTLGLI